MHGQRVLLVIFFYSVKNVTGIIYVNLLVNVLLNRVILLSKFNIVQEHVQYYLCMLTVVIDQFLS